MTNTGNIFLSTANAALGTTGNNTRDDSSQRIAQTFARQRLEAGTRVYNADYHSGITFEGSSIPNSQATSILNRQTQIQDAMNRIQTMLTSGAITQAQADGIRNELANRIRGIANEDGEIGNRNRSILSTWQQTPGVANLGRLADWFAGLAGGRGTGTENLRDANLNSIRSTIIGRDTITQRRDGNLSRLDSILPGLASENQATFSQAATRLLDQPFTYVNNTSTNEQRRLDSQVANNARDSFQAAGTTVDNLRTGQRVLGRAAGTVVDVMTLGQAPELSALVEGGVRGLSSLGELAGGQSAREVGNQLQDIAFDTAGNVATARVTGGTVGRIVGGNNASSTVRRIAGQVASQIAGDRAGDLVGDALRDLVTGGGPQRPSNQGGLPQAQNQTAQQTNQQTGSTGGPGLGMNQLGLAQSIVTAALTAQRQVQNAQAVPLPPPQIPATIVSGTSGRFQIPAGAQVEIRLPLEEGSGNFVPIGHSYTNGFNLGEDGSYSFHPGYPALGEYTLRINGREYNFNVVAPAPPTPPPPPPLVNPINLMDNDPRADLTNIYNRVLTFDVPVGSQAPRFHLQGLISINGSPGIHHYNSYEDSNHLNGYQLEQDVTGYEESNFYIMRETRNGRDCYTIGLKNLFNGTFHIEHGGRTYNIPTHRHNEFRATS